MFLHMSPYGETNEYNESHFEITGSYIKIIIRYIESSKDIRIAQDSQVVSLSFFHNFKMRGGCKYFPKIG